ncbi:type IV pilin [Natronosalvus halobius]|uniref:type IV pilin n=1 Tax=Natronosalvus halobius TaxID=2953746 RepID=UPI0020A195BB|nr:type IV pilin N-terminal domain-containing protein [Natronosalvus halobius]USZ71987.1 type IV pilin N-terminal domain-containing protein [Natronosalvus halobius]
MDLKKYRSKLIGNESERAVSPVIGVILMVAITVILAAVIAAFVLDLGASTGEGPVNAVVATETDNAAGEIKVTIQDSGQAGNFKYVVDNGDQNDLGISSTGQSITLDDSDADIPASGNGEIKIIAVDGDSETVVSTQEFNF